MKRNESSVAVGLSPTPRALNPNRASPVSWPQKQVSHPGGFPPIRNGWSMVFFMPKIGAKHWDTPWKTNMSPENHWLEDVFPIEIAPF